MTNQHWTDIVGAWSVANRFWVKVAIGKPDECWPFLGGKDKRGYGRFGLTALTGEVKYAHIVAYELVNGPASVGMDVCHSCNYKPCCNYHHLSEGTSQKNAEDAARDGLIKHGEVHHKSKNTDADVLACVEEYMTSHVTQRQLAKACGVRQSTVSRWISGVRRG